MSPLSSNSKNVLVEAGQGLTAVELAICDLLSEGKTQSEIHRELGIDVKKLWRMRASKPAFASEFMRAWEQGADALGESLLTLHERITDAKMANVASNNLKFYLERRHRRLYGASIDVQSTVTIQLGTALAEAKARTLRPMCDPEPAIDGEFVALPHTREGHAPDCVSEEVALSFTPDIFS
jgi:hypothetical protein